jgi:O-antigen/teichoic acid export membrane protein
MEGAAIATLASQAAVTVYLFIYASKLVRIRLGSYIWRPIIAAGVMGLALVFSPLNVVVNILIGTAVYLAALFLLGGIGKKDVDFVRRYL